MFISTWLTVMGPGNGGAVDRYRVPVGVVSSVVWTPFSCVAVVTSQPSASLA